jgi:hypothetical protein
LRMPARGSAGRRRSGSNRAASSPRRNGTSGPMPTVSSSTSAALAGRQTKPVPRASMPSSGSNASASTGSWISTTPARNGRGLADRKKRSETARRHRRQGPDVLDPNVRDSRPGSKSAGDSHLNRSRFRGQTKPHHQSRRPRMKDRGHVSIP